MNKRTITNEENKAIQLSILKYYDHFCKEHGLQYYLSDGTLLGAIRHKGFIPWDDDIDVEMPRSDWLRIRELFINQDPYVLCYPTDKDSKVHCIKIYDNRTIKIEGGVAYSNDYLGVDIDIFSIDGSADDQHVYEQDRETIYTLFNRSCEIKCGYIGSFKHKIKILLMTIIYGKPKTLMNKAINLCRKHSLENSKYATRYGRFGRGYRVPIDCYKEAILVDFEGEKFPAPIGYDAVLKAQYGNYMELPPEEKRITHHTNEVYWR